MKTHWKAALGAAVAAVAAVAVPAAVGWTRGRDGPRSQAGASRPGTAGELDKPMQDSIVKSEEEWRRQLTPTQFRILRKHGTERAFTGEFWDHHERGAYLCAACGLEMFRSEAKFESGTGWPSFWKPASDSNVATSADRGLLMTRTEVHCRRCGGHLGHVFDDGPAPTGLRYCINSAALSFRKEP